mmetsp:Transcript_17454/g.37717  ORF Transcript_17454/g.37717 Transcript_17454/m.37717 type:complete len:209 (-) Transcript_17454:86-712(-)
MSRSGSCHAETCLYAWAWRALRWWCRRSAFWSRGCGAGPGALAWSSGRRLRVCSCRRRSMCSILADLTCTCHGSSCATRTTWTARDLTPRSSTSSSSRWGTWTAPQSGPTLPPQRTVRPPGRCPAPARAQHPGHWGRPRPQLLTSQRPALPTSCSAQCPWPRRCPWPHQRRRMRWGRRSPLGNRWSRWSWSHTQRRTPSLSWWSLLRW